SAGANGNVKWQEVRPSKPCPICDKGDWCSVSDCGTWACCRRLGTHPIYGKGDERTDASGGAYWSYCLRPDTGTGQEPRYSLADGAGKRADPDTLDRVYSRLPQELPLGQEHTEALRGRGLSGDLLRAGYRTLGKGRARAVQVLVRAGLEQHFPQVP